MLVYSVQNNSSIKESKRKMAHILIMPKQGNTVESCIITGWKVKEGDAVSAETIVCEVETDKAAFELPAGAAGIVLKILRKAGDDVPVLEAIAVIGEAGEEFTTNNTNEEGKEREEWGVGTVPGSIPVLPIQTESGTVCHPISPRARGLAEKEGLATDGLQGSGPDGRVIERDIKAALENRPALTAAAKEAVAGGTAALPETGTGLAGRVTVEDLASSKQPSVPAAEYSDTPVKGIRKIISERMLKSLAETAQFTLNAQAPVGRLLDMRNRLKSLSTEDLTQRHKDTKGVGIVYDTIRLPSVNDFILYAVSRALQQFPYMNAHFLGDAIRTFNRVHLGHAVDTPRGLMVPVIKDANLLSLAQISAEAKRLATACKNGDVKPDELTGSTFTVSNLGSLGVTSFTPVLNAPEVGILGVCAITKRLTTEEHGEEKRGRSDQYIGFSLTINHQAVDGAPAARFLKALCEAVENIDLLLMER
jgi:pyruvate dehydrogenase E2 component (dihydrolipoamide acetyltransferase)